VEFQAVLTVDPKNDLALYGRGLAKRSLGDSAGSEADITAARQAAPLVSADFWDAKLIPAP
jgi:hypothetical protein